MSEHDEADVETTESRETLQSHSAPADTSAATALQSLALEPAINQVSEDLWFHAYQELSKREPDLLEDYERHIEQDLDLSPTDTSGSNRSKLLSSPTTIQNTLEALQNERNSKQWKFSIRSKSHKVRDQLEKLVKLLALADKVVKEVASAQPYAALAWSAVSFFLPLLREGFAKETAMVQGFTTIGELQGYWRNCEDVYLKSKSSEHYQNLVEPLTQVYSYMLEYQIRAICHLSKKQLSRAWAKVTGYDDWASKEANIVRISNQCLANIGPLEKNEIRKNFETHMQKLDRLVELGTNISKTMNDHRRQDEEEKLLQALKKAAKNYRGDMEYNPDPVKGTCEWFFNNEDFTNWRDSDDSGVFWITAGPGCGKSVLARTLITQGHLDRTTTIVDMSSVTVNSCEATVCYFFFKEESSDKISQRSSMNSALCAILHQLFCQESTESLIEHALPLFRRCGDELTNDVEDLWTVLLDCSEKYINDDIICVLDALDECNSHDRQQLIRRLDQLYADRRPSTKRPKFLITSRPYDDIEQSFKPVSKHAQYFRFDADERHNEISHDIGLVIDSKVGSFASNFRKEDQDRIAERLKSQGTKTYLWLQLTLKIIASRPRHYGRPRDVEALLSVIPSEVSEAYDRILSRTEDDITTSLLLQIVLAARRPLTLDEANFALTLAREGADIETHEQLEDACWPGDFKSDVTNICGLIINVYDGKLLFIHLTAREFLVKTPKLAVANTWGGRFADSAALHAIMARACMQYLLFSELIWQVRPLMQEANEKHKLFGYASAFWPLHFNAMAKVEDSELLQQARHLCSHAQSRLANWGRDYLNSLDQERPNSLPESFFGWTDLAVACFLGMDDLVLYLLKDENLDVNESCNGYGSALHTAAAVGEETIVRILLSNNADVNMVSIDHGTPLDIAVTVSQSADIAKLLLANGASPMEESQHRAKLIDVLDNRYNSFEFWGILDKPVTILRCAAIFEYKDFVHTVLRDILGIYKLENILQASCSDSLKELGPECVALVLDLLDNEQLQSVQMSSEDAVRALTSIPSTTRRALHLVAQNNQQILLLGEDVLRNISVLKESGVFLQQYLSKIEGPVAEITSGTLQAVATYFDPDTLRAFIAKSSQQRLQIPDLLSSARSNWKWQDVMLEVIFELAPAAEFREQIQFRLTHSTSIEEISTLLHKARQLPTKELVKSVNDILLELWGTTPLSSEDKLAVLKHLLEHCSNMDDMDGVNFQLAVAYCPVSAIDILIEYLPRNCVTGEIILSAAARNRTYGSDIMERLLEMQEPHAAVASRVIISAVQNNSKALKFLLERYGDEMKITADILMYARGWLVFELLLFHKRDDVMAAAPMALHLASRYDRKQPKLRKIKSLLSYCPSFWFEVTEVLLLDVLLKEPDTAYEELSLLIDKLGDKIEITEKVLAAAASNSGKTLMLLRCWKPEAFQITTQLMALVAASGSLATFNYLDKESTDKTVVTDELRQLAKFRYLLLRGGTSAGVEKVEDQWRRGAVTDSADVHGLTALHVASRNRGFNPKMIRFLLETVKADVHAVDRWGRTPLHYAASGATHIFGVLVAAEGNLQAVDLEGETPISLVEKQYRERKEAGRSGASESLKLDIIRSFGGDTTLGQSESDGEMESE